MAKLGEGDPRWIVAEREDGANVNNWHWAEKDVTIWSKGRLKELFENKSLVTTPTLKCKSTWFDKNEGEVTLYNRKGKICFVMEYHLSINCEGEQTDLDGKVVSEGKARLTCPEIEHDHEPDEVEVKVDLISDTKDGSFSKALKSEGVRFVRTQLAVFYNDLREGHKVQTKPKSQVTSPPQKPADIASKNLDVTEFSQSLEWRAPTQELWDVLVNEGKVSAYTRSPARIALKSGGEFSFLNGSISGSFTEVEERKCLKMKWRLHDWPQGFFSDVQITLRSNEAGTTDMTLTQSNIPKNEVERTKQGWERNFWDPIKMIFGFGFEWK